MNVSYYFKFENLKSLCVRVSLLAFPLIFISSCFLVEGRLCLHGGFSDLTSVSLRSGPQLGLLLSVQHFNLTLRRLSQSLRHQGLEDGPHGLLLCSLIYLELCFLIDLVLWDFLLLSFIYAFKRFLSTSVNILFCFCY